MRNERQGYKNKFISTHVRIWVSWRWTWLIPGDDKLRRLEVRVNQGHRYNRLRILWYWTDRFFELVASYRHRGCDNAAVARDWSTKSEFGLS